MYVMQKHRIVYDSNVNIFTSKMLAKKGIFYTIYIYIYIYGGARWHSG
jgi:hypothetical protein